ncbi:MAG TPA: hypothetical protein VFY28_03455 [Candidatus Paceibacterota bacterium]|nr:hypothetical protein [Candidatus Paceibacterota bacterium]
MGSDSELHFINVSYFFRLLYDLFTGGHTYSGGSLWTDLVALLTTAWVLVTIIAFLITFAAIAVLIHSTVRMHATKRQEAPKYATIGAHAAEERRDHRRWSHVITLIESPNQSDWRQAIIEADIMLDDLLIQLGYVGATTGEKLKAVNPEHFKTINDAWEAHKVRNEIAHQGSSFELSDHLAYRTIKRYENVMVEHGEI